MWVKSRTSLCYRLMKNSSSRPTWEYSKGMWVSRTGCGLRAGCGLAGRICEVGAKPAGQLWRSVWTGKASEQGTGPSVG